MSENGQTYRVDPSINGGMNLDPHICYTAVKSRDARFDGRFYTAVKSTGIYCRPICPARTPKRQNCDFYACAAAAEEAGFRPCLRCRPEASPGTPAWLGTSATVYRGIRLINEGALDSGGVDTLAARLGVGARHLRRLFNEHLGASPLAVAQTRRVHLARKLLDETRLPVTEIAFSAGFQSVRRFNAAMHKTYGCSPSALRSMSRHAGRVPINGYLRLRLPYRAPFDWQSIVDFLKPRAIPGVEKVDRKAYQRTIALDDMRGLLEVKPSADESCLILKAPVASSRHLVGIVQRVRNLFDLDADPDAIDWHLGEDRLLEKRVRAKPGLRMPGAWDRFEVAVRAVLGQQVTVKAASTLAGRLVRAFGETDGSYRFFPAPEALCDADIASIGLPQSRAEAIRNLAKAVAEKTLRLDDCDEAREVLQEIPGIGPWTVQYIAMRALKEPDAFPEGDLGLRRALGQGKKPATPAQLLEAAERWRPWRAYAAMQLWMNP